MKNACWIVACLGSIATVVLAQEAIKPAQLPPGPAAETTGPAEALRI